MIADEMKEAATVALTRKPRGNMARAFYRYIETLVREADALREVEGKKARKRQVQIGEELARYKFPMCADMGEYDLGQSAGEWEILAKQGGEYYPEAQRKADDEAAYEAAEEEHREFQDGAKADLLGALSDALNKAEIDLPHPDLDDDIPF